MMKLPHSCGATESEMTYLTVQDIEVLASALNSTLSLPDGHISKEQGLLVLELRVQESIDLLVSMGVTDDDPRLVRLRSL